jgi:hypothetical protein
LLDALQTQLPQIDAEQEAKPCFEALASSSLGNVMPINQNSKGYLIGSLVVEVPAWTVSLIATSYGYLE